MEDECSRDENVKVNEWRDQIRNSRYMSDFDSIPDERIDIYVLKAHKAVNLDVL